MSSYCLKCKKETPNTNVKTITEKGRKRIVSKYKVCKAKKSKFVKQYGKGIVDTFINNLPFEAHLPVSFHPEPFQSNDPSIKDKKPGKTYKAEFLGPGTKFKERSSKGERGLNLLDHYAYEYDKSYQSKNPEIRNKADQKLYEEAESYLKRPDLTMVDKVDANIVRAAMKLIKR